MSGAATDNGVNVCYLCDESDQGYETCQDCGRMICFDDEHTDDICAPAYVTCTGDLFCWPCGLRHDRAQDEEEEGAGFFEEYFSGELP